MTSVTLRSPTKSRRLSSSSLNDKEKLQTEEQESIPIENIASQVVHNVKKTRIEQNSKSDDPEDQSIEMAEAFIQTISQIKTKKYCPPKLELDDDDDFLFPIPIKVANPVDQLTPVAASDPQKLEKIKPFRRLSAQFEDKLDRKSYNEERISHALYDLASVCSAFSEEHSKKGEPTSFDLSKNLLLSLCNIKDYTPRSPIKHRNFVNKSNSQLQLQQQQQEQDNNQPETKALSQEKVDNPEAEVWVPPRLQVYFNTHKMPRNGPEQQGNRCYYCGKIMTSFLLSSPRYCEYTGKYYCKDCHSGATQFIPARIIQNWDFGLYKVSNKAFEYIEAIKREPIFDILAINPRLYQQQEQLNKIKMMRTQLNFLRDYLNTCHRHNNILQKKFELRMHLVNFVDMYSLEDLIQVYNSSLDTFLKRAVSEFVNHVTSCESCKVRGFICEFCHSDEILYPFQLKIVFQCPKCKSFFHQRCYVESRCPKCTRNEASRLRAISRSIRSSQFVAFS